MKILFLTPRVPHARITSGHFIVYQRIQRLLRRGHQVGLVSFTDDEGRAHAAEWKPHLLDLELLPRPAPPPRWRRAGGHLLASVPPPFLSLHSTEMFKRVGDVADRSGYEYVIAEFCPMGQYVHHNRWLPAIRKIISCHQCATTAARKALSLQGCSPRSPLDHMRLRNLQRYEFEIYQSADRVLVLTQEERLALLALAPDLRVTVIPSGVDIDVFKPPTARTSEDIILYTGIYECEANRDAVRWFVRAAWPLLTTRHPDLQFYVVGSNPTPDMQEYARQDPRIHVTGAVEDVRPYLARAREFVCPMRLGSGLRGKILEAMAAGVPVVSTTLGAEGIPAQVGENCFLADDPDIMAKYIDLLLSDPALCASIAQRARTLVTERFTWTRSVDLLEKALRLTREDR